MSNCGELDSDVEGDRVWMTCTCGPSIVMTEQRIHAKSSEEYIKAVEAAADPVVLKMQSFLAETNNANVSALMSSRCIASNDPRLRQ